MNRADKLIFGRLITLDDRKPFAEAMAVRNGRILYVGGKETAKTLFGEGAEVLDYGENYVYPGFLEAHAHGLAAGWKTAGQFDLSPGKSYDEYREIIREYIRKNPGRPYYFGGGWIEQGDVLPTKALLDDLCPDVPMALTSSDGHSMLVNSACIAFYGVTKDIAKEYKPGEIVLDENGELTGLVRETPSQQLFREVPLELGDIREFLLTWQEYALSHGFVGAAEAGDQMFTPLLDRAFASLAAEKKLKFRTYSYFFVSEFCKDPASEVRKASLVRKRFDSEYYKTVGIKVFNDGVVEAHSAWLAEDYRDEPGYHGVERFNDREKMVRLLVEADKYGFSVHSHSDGSGAIRFQLDCIEEAERITGDPDQRNCLAHLQVVRDEDIPRFADLNAAAIVAPLWTPKSDDFFAQEVEYLGRENAEKGYPIRSFADAGALIAFHSDFPVSSKFDIPMTLYNAATRHSPGKTNVRGEDETLTRKQALLAMTRDVAYLWREENRMGTLEPGKLANLSVFDTDFLNGDVETFPQAKLVATVVDGDEAFRTEKG